MSSMTVTYLGAIHARGTGRTGNSYDFAQVKVAAPIRNVANDTRQVVAYGSEEQTIDLDPACLDQFAGLESGSQVELLICPNPRNIQRNICTGVAG